MIIQGNFSEMNDEEILRLARKVTETKMTNGQVLSSLQDAYAAAGTDVFAQLNRAIETTSSVKRGFASLVDENYENELGDLWPAGQPTLSSASNEAWNTIDRFGSYKEPGFVEWLVTGFIEGLRNTREFLSR